MGSTSPLLVLWNVVCSPIWLAAVLGVAALALVSACSLVIVAPLSFIVCLPFLMCSKNPYGSSADPKGKHVVITGGSSGIGKAMAQEFVSRGAHVTLVARDAARLEVAANEIRSLVGQSGGGSVKIAAADVTGGDVQLKAALGSAWGMDGNDVLVDVLVCSAGVSLPATFQESTSEEWEQTIRINVLGCVTSIKAVLGGMKQRRSGQILVISSMAGQLGVYGMSSYCASKFALRGMAEALRMEVKPFGVQVSMAFPPDTDTPMLAKELEVKSLECKLVSESGGVWSADEVAKGLVKGLGSGGFLIGLGIDGWMLNHLHVGMLPPTNLFEFATGALLLPVFRIAAACYSFNWDRIVRREHVKKQQALAAQDAGITANLN